MDRGKYLIVVGGPTAAGKTERAIQLARHFDTEILSCDSRQCFRELRIGTAKPTAAQQRQVVHHFIDHLSIREPYSVGAYVREALDRLRALYARRDTAVLVGGSGLYLKALCEGLDDFPAVPGRVRAAVEHDYEQRGLEALQHELAASDPDYYAEVDLQNPVRLMRALAVIRSSGRPFSSFRRGSRPARPFRPVYLWMHGPRQALYDRIDRRVERMIQQGLVEEARTLLPYRQADALQTVGYRELFAYFDGAYDLAQAIDRIKRNTRRYAKRQITWRRRDGHWTLVDRRQEREAIELAELAIETHLAFRHYRPADDWPERLPFSPTARARDFSLLSASQTGERRACLLLHQDRGGGWMAGPWPIGRQAGNDLLFRLIQQGIRHLGEGARGAAFSSYGKPFARDFGFVESNASSDRLVARLEAVGLSSEQWATYSLNR